MARLSAALRRAVESDCATDMNEIVRAKNSRDFEQLRGLLARPTARNLQAKTRAIYALGRWGDESAVSDIRKAIPQLDEPGLLAAIDALGRLDTPTAVKEVIKHRKHSSADVRKFVILALARSSAPDATAHLKEMQKREPVVDLKRLAKKHSGRGLRKR